MPATTPRITFRSMSWTSKLVTLSLIAGMCFITWWARVQSDNIDVMAVTSEMRSASIQLSDRVEQILNRAEQVTALAAQSKQEHAPADLLVDGIDNSAVIITDKHGRVTASTLLGPGTSVVGSEYFERVRQSRTDRMHIGSPVKLSADGFEMVPAARAIRDSSGNFAGAVIVAIRAGHFTETQRLPRRPNTAFAVVDRNGRMLAASLDGKSNSVPAIDQNLWQRISSLAVTTANPPIFSGLFGNDPRMTILRPLSSHELSVLVAVERQSASGATQPVFNVIYLVIGALCLTIFNISTFIHRQTTRLRHALETQRHAETALRDEKEFFSSTLASIEDGVLTLDAEKRITYCNRRVEAMTGLVAAQLLGRSVYEAIQIMPRDASESMRDAVHALWARKQGSAQLIATNGECLSIEFCLTDLTQEHAGASAVLVLHDVSKATQMAATLSYQASHDALTGLLNRTAFDSKLRAALETAVTEQRKHVLLFLDLDQFKVVNDTCGHAAGDELLKQVGFLFGQVLRKHDTLARTGGDEFAVLLEDCPVDFALGIGDKLRGQLSAFRFAWKDKSFQVGVTIGAVVINDASGALEDVKRKADTACYIAKDEGRGRTHLYLDSDEAVLARQGEMSWATRLQKALTNGDFELYGQRIESTKPEPVHYYEMLIRLKEADGSLVPPMAFLPAAERYGLMPVLDRAVIERALEMHGKLQAASNVPVRFAINLSGASLSDPSLFEFIRGALKRYAVAPKLICFEVTETMAIANLSVAVKLMTALKELGCTLSLDDFGSGMSSFSYLKQLPVDVVKIDGSFVRNILQDAVDHAMVEAVNNIAHQMGLQTLAEYAESPEIVAELKRMGIDMVQGFAVSRPQRLTEMLASQRAS